MIITKPQQFIIFDCDEPNLAISSLPTETKNKIDRIQKIRQPVGGTIVAWTNTSPQFSDLEKNTIYLVYTKPGQTGYEIPGAVDASGYCLSPKDINIVASSTNNELSFNCNEGVVCPEGVNCCGFYGNLEYEGYGENSLIVYQSISFGSKLSFNREYSKYNLTSNLDAGSNLVKLTNGTTIGMTTGQILIKFGGSGSPGEESTILSIISENEFLTSKNHQTSGPVVFGIPKETDDPSVLELRLNDGTYYGIIMNSYKNYSGFFEINDNSKKYIGSFIPDEGKDYSTIKLVGNL